VSIFPITVYEAPRRVPAAYPLALSRIITSIVNVDIIAEPITITINQSGSINIEFIVEPITITINQRGNITHYPPAPINPALDQDIKGTGFDTLITISGSWLNVNRDANPIEVTLSVLGNIIIGKLLSSTALLTLTLDMGDPEIVTIETRKNWVKWSNIGNLDFTIWKDNIAGERPLDWNGWVYGIKKLGNKVIVYGEGGVSMLAPSSNTFGLLSIYKIGLKSRQSFDGDDKIQFFVDAIGKLYSIGEIAMKSSLFESSITPVELDYSEYLNSMGRIVLSWDALNRLLYICDGVLGYVYSPENKSLGSGPINITGIGVREDNLYITAPSTIVNPVFEICTDIYDMGSRKNKTISTVELGIDVTGDLWITLDYRLDKAVAFKTLSWHKVSPNGVTNIPCYGVEFRVRVKKTTFAYFELDYIRVNGIIHNYTFQYPYIGR